MLQLAGITVSFGDRPVLAGVDLSVGDGEIVALLGASGSGKTTLLRAIAGLVPTDAGSIAWDDQALTGVPAHRRRFGLVFQDFALFPHLDVAGNVGFGLAGVPDDERAGRVARELERVGLASFERRAVGELSGGQAQRVALARSLAADPRLLLLDEPLGALDRTLRRDLAADLRAALRSAGIPALHVTHDPAEAFAVADRIAILHDGRIARTGTPERVWSVPGTEPVARLLGHTAIVDVTIDREGVHLGHGEGRHARAIVREDAVRVTTEGPVEGIVEKSVFQGPGHVLAVTVAGGTITVPHASPIEPGRAVRLAIDPKGITVLEP